MHVYHYAPYEPSAFKRLMGRHATRGKRSSTACSAPGSSSISRRRRQGLRASVESYSIKELERFYGFEREADLREAGRAPAASSSSRSRTANPDAIPPEVRTLVEDYNQEDCVSALELRTGSNRCGRSRRRPASPFRARRSRTAKASEELEEREAEVQAAMDALLAGVP